MKLYQELEQAKNEHLIDVQKLEIKNEELQLQIEKLEKAKNEKMD